MWQYWKLGTLRPQAELQGLREGLPPDMQYAGPPESGIRPGAHDQTPSYGSNSTTALWSPSGQERLRESTPKEKTGVKPHRRISDQVTLFRQLLQRNWYQMYWVSFPLEHTSNTERGILTHGQPRFSISSAQACILERILQRHLMVSTQHGKQLLPVISLTAKLA